MSRKISIALLGMTGNVFVAVQRSIRQVNVCRIFVCCYSLGFEILLICGIAWEVPDPG